jgi:hypothetical protein
MLTAAASQPSKAPPGAAARPGHSCATQAVGARLDRMTGRVRGTFDPAARDGGDIGL